jgi:hypothetical protein
LPDEIDLYLKTLSAIVELNPDWVGTLLASEEETEDLRKAKEGEIYVMRYIKEESKRTPVAVRYGRSNSMVSCSGCLGMSPDDMTLMLDQVAVGTTPSFNQYPCESRPSEPISRYRQYHLRTDRFQVDPLELVRLERRTTRPGRGREEA